MLNLAALKGSEVLTVNFGYADSASGRGREDAKISIGNTNISSLYFT